MKDKIIANLGGDLPRPRELLIDELYASENKLPKRNTGTKECLGPVQHPFSRFSQKRRENAWYLSAMTRGGGGVERNNKTRNPRCVLCADIFGWRMKFYTLNLSSLEPLEKEKITTLISKSTWMDQEEVKSLLPGSRAHKELRQIFIKPREKDHRGKGC